jgi:hypothetical protein
VVGLLKGLGHHLSFAVDLNTSRGQGTSSTVGSPSISGGRLLLPASATASWDFGYTGDWTLIGGVETSGTVYYAVTSGGTKYKDGATTTDTITNYMNISGGVMTLTDAYGSGDTYFTYVAALPYLLDGDQMADITAAGDSAFADLPRLLVGGTVLRGGTGTFRLVPNTVKEKPVQYVSGGSTLLGWEVAFKLAEVSGDA